MCVCVEGGKGGGGGGARACERGWWGEGERRGAGDGKRTNRAGILDLYTEQRTIHPPRY